MPPPPSDLQVVREAVRNFLRDFAHENRLVAGEESSNPQIDLAILMALDDFNFATVPLIGNFQLSTFPSLSLLVTGAAIWVLKSTGILQTRNFLNFNSGGISAVLSDRSAAWQNWIRVLQQEYETKKAEVKAFLNLREGWGGVATPYGSLAYYRGGFAPSVQEVFVGFRGFY